MDMAYCFFKKGSFALAFLLSSSLSGFAADYALTPEQFDTRWAGFYAGVFAGYGVGNADTTDIGNGSADIDISGATGGLILGINWQTGAFVYGLEADLGIHEFKGNGGGVGGVIDQTFDHLWSGHVRGRLGYAFDRYLPFIAGGVSFGEAHDHRTALFADGGIDSLTGWTVGAGVDAEITPHIFGRIEYLYESLPDAGFTFASLGGRTVNADVDTHIFRAALLVKSQGFGPSINQFEPSYTSRWSGFYTGVTAGGAFGEADIRQLTGAAAGTADSMDMDGGLVGALFGWNYQYNNAVFGIEGDLSLSSIEGSVSGGPTIAMNADIFWLATVRARAGYAFGAFLPYVTAGYSVAQVDDAQTGVLGSAADPLKQGVTVGAGVDYAITDMLAARASYDYIHYGKETFGPGGIVMTFEPDLHLVRAGLVLKLSD
jgi:outer membrane immunogenic protein